MAVSIAVLRSQIESALAGRVAAPFEHRASRPETAPLGISQTDALTEGLPRGSLTEICGPACSGRATLLLSILASRTTQGEACALVDGRDGFDPYSAKAAGIRPEQLLWVRCHNVDQALKATDLLIQGGGFGLIALDLSDSPAKSVRQIQLSVWFRFRRAVENTSTILLLLDQETNAKSCASLVLRLNAEPEQWPMAAEAQDFPSACLLGDSQIRTDLLRSRWKPGCGAFQHRESAMNAGENAATFHAKPYWDFCREVSTEKR